MKLYIAGPMTGVEDFNFPLFISIARKLEAAGYEIVNPAEIHIGMPVESRIWKECLRRDIAELIQCDGIATLANWRLSKGANLEVYIATQLEMPVAMWDDWLRKATEKISPLAPAACSVPPTP